MVTSLLAGLLLHHLRTCLVCGLDTGGQRRIKHTTCATVTVNLSQLQQIYFAQSRKTLHPFLQYQQVLLRSILCRALSYDVPLVRNQ